MSGFPRDDERLSAYLDGELDPVTASELEAQIAQDPALAAQLDAVHEVVVGLRGLDAVEPPPGFTARLRASLADQTADAPQEPAGATVIALPRWRRRVAVASAAAVLAAVGLVGGSALLRQAGSGSGATAVHTPARSRMDPHLGDAAAVRDFFAGETEGSLAASNCPDPEPGEVTRSIRIVYDGDPAVAYVVERAERTEVVVLDQSSCAVALVTPL